MINDFKIPIRVHRIKILEEIKLLKEEAQKINQESNSSDHEINNTTGIMKDTPKLIESSGFVNSSLRFSPKSEEENMQNSELIQNEKNTLSSFNILLRVVEGSIINSNYLIGKRGASIGRHSSTNDVVIPESFVSRKHCEIIFYNNNFYLQDLGSTTGTFLMIN